LAAQQQEQQEPDQQAYRAYLGFLAGSLKFLKNS